MTGIRFLAAADLHLKANEPLGVYDSDKGINRRTAQKLSILQHMLQHAVDENMNFVVLAGDMIDTPAPPRQLSHRIATIIREYVDEVDIFWIPGNHDWRGGVSAFSSEGTLARAGFHVVDGFEKHVINDVNVGFCSYAATREMVEQGESARTDLLFGHVYVQGANVAKSNRPLRLKGSGVSADQLRARDVILGDVHIRQEIAGERTHVMYTGCLARVDISDSDQPVGYIEGYVSPQHNAREFTYHDVDDIDIVRLRFADDETVATDVIECVQREIDERNVDVLDIFCTGDPTWLMDARLADIKKLLRKDAVFNLRTRVLHPDYDQGLLADEGAGNVALSARWDEYCDQQKDVDNDRRGFVYELLTEHEEDGTRVTGPEYYIQSLVLHRINRFADECELDDIPMDASIAVVGNNKDVMTADSNGVGKSGVFNAISWALLGKMPGKGINIGNVNADNYHVDLCLVTNNDIRLHVLRGYDGNRTYLRADKNGAPLVPNETRIDSIQREICRELGIPDAKADGAGLFFNVAFLSFSFVKDFVGIDTDPADRIRLASKLLGLDLIGALLDDVKKRRTVLIRQVDSAQSRHAQLAGLLSSTDVRNVDPTLPADHDGAIDYLCAECDRLEEQLSDLDEEIIAHKSKSAQLEQYIELKEKLDGLREQRDSELTPLRSKLTALTEQEKHRDLLLGEIDALQDKFAAIEDLEQQLADLRDRKSDILDTLKARNAELSSVQDRLRFGQQSIDASLVCPACSVPLQAQRGKEGLVLEEFDYDTVVKEVRAAEQQCAELLSSTEKMNTDLAAVENDLVAVYQRQQERVHIEQELQKKTNESRSLRDLDSKIDEIDKRGRKLADHYDSQLRTVSEQMDALVGVVDPELDEKGRELMHKRQATHDKWVQFKDKQARVEGEKDRRKGIEKQIREQETKTAACVRERDMHEWAVVALPAFRAHEIVKMSYNIEQRANQNLQLLGSSMRISLEMGGDARGPKLNIIVIDEDGLSRPIETYSSGERERISLATTFALREIGELIGGLRVGWCCMDEVWDGLDSSGKHSLVSFLDDQPGQYFIISHSEQLAQMLPHQIIVERENGESSFVTQKE